MKNYSVLAKYYDRFSHNDCDYESWSQYLCGVAKGCGAKLVADVACGTGKMTSLLVKNGFSVVGVDSSAEMLQIASDKCRGATFVRQDMRKLALPRQFDMITVVNDGVNYLKPEELESFFATVATNLQKGAPLVFDVSSPYKLTEVLGNNVFFFDCDEATLLWTNRARQNKVTLSLTLFERENDKYVRYDEQHVQYVHTQNQLCSALENSGFSVVEITEYGKKLKSDSLRLTFFAKKRH